MTWESPTDDERQHESRRQELADLTIALGDERDAYAVLEQATKAHATRWAKLRESVVLELRKSRGSGVVQEERRLTLRRMLDAMAVLDADVYVGDKGFAT